MDSALCWHKESKGRWASRLEYMAKSPMDFETYITEQLSAVWSTTMSVSSLEYSIVDDELEYISSMVCLNKSKLEDVCPLLLCVTHRAYPASL